MSQPIETNEPNLDRRYRWFKIQLPNSKKKLVSYIFRGLTREEIRLAGTKSGQNESDTYALQMCVLGNRNWEIELYGVTKRLLDEIYRVSGITEEALTLKEAVAWMETPEGLIEAGAVGFVAGCSLRELYNCDPADYAKYVMLGKFLFQSGKKIDDLFGTPETQDAATTIPLVGTDYSNVGHQVQDLQVSDKKVNVEEFKWVKPKQVEGLILTKDDVATVNLKNKRKTK